MENVENVEKKGEGGENVEKPVWYTTFVWEPTDEAMKALAANNIQVNKEVLFDRIPFASEHITAVKDTIVLKGDRVKIKGNIHTAVRVKICYDNDYNEVPEDSPNKWSCEDFYDPSDYVIAHYGYNTNALINKEINRFAMDKQRVPTEEEVRDIIFSVLKKLQSELDSREERRQALAQKAKQWLEKKRKEHEEWLRKKQAEEEERRKKEEQERQRLLSKPWIKAIYEANEVKKMRQEEIQRFKEKFSLTDEEINTWETSNKPYVHIEASVDLRPLDISRTVKIRNFYPDSFVEVSDAYDDAFSDLSWFVAKTLAKHFDGDVSVWVDDGDYPNTAYLVVTTENDTIEVASSDVNDS